MIEIVSFHQSLYPLIVLATEMHNFNEEEFNEEEFKKRF